MSVRWWAGITAILMALVVATVAFAQGDPVAQGARLYADNCAVCHGPQGEGRVGARLKDFPSINPQAFVKATVANGVPGSKMPAWSKAKGGPLTDAEIDAIAAFVATWTTGSVPAAPTERLGRWQLLPTVAGVSGDPTRGAQVFQQNCLVCHGAQGRGPCGRESRQAVRQRLSGCVRQAGSLQRRARLGDAGLGAIERRPAHRSAD